MAGSRVLVTGIGTFWGGRLAQALENDPDVEVVVGVDTRPPVVPLARTEVVRADSTHSILARLVAATEVDTVLHTHLEVDSTKVSDRALHETNVIGTMNLLAAAGAPDSTVRKLVVKSSTLVYGASPKDPYFFREEAGRSRPARTRVERSLLEVEGYLADFATDHPETVTTVLRFSNVLGEDLDTPLARALRRPVAPEVFGFDPRLQFTHLDDVLAALTYAHDHDLAGTYNVAGDEVLSWSEVCAMVGRRRLAVPPYFTRPAAAALHLLRVADLPPELLALLRYGRGVDNAKLKAAGFVYRYTSAETVDAFARSARLTATLGRRPTSGYRYDPALEAFFRHSPAVRKDPG